MAKKAKPILGSTALADFGNIFASTVPSETLSADNATNNGISFAENKECIVEIPLDELHPPEYHPFHVNDDECMDRLVKNIAKYGVREPGLVRPRPEGGYELVAGNRRKRACELAGIPTMPVIIRKMNNNDAAIAMVDSNLEQRECLLPSEKAWAYKIKMEALNHNGVKGEKHSHEVLMEQTGDSKNQIFRLLRLTELVADLLDRVDTKRLAFNPAVELSYLDQKEQIAVVEAMDNYEIKPSLSQAVQLKKMKLAGELTPAIIDEVLSALKKEPRENASISQFTEFFPEGYSLRQMSEVITDLLQEWQSKVNVVVSEGSA